MGCHGPTEAHLLNYLLLNSSARELLYEDARAAQPTGLHLTLFYHPLLTRALSLYNEDSDDDFCRKLRLRLEPLLV